MTEFFFNNIKLCVYIYIYTICLFPNYKKGIILPPGCAFENIFRNCKISNVKIISLKQRISQGNMRIY